MERGLPDWWTWEVDLTPHLLDRLEDRGLREVELRRMLLRPASISRQIASDRWLLVARGPRELWRIVVEPDPDRQQLVVITAYPVSS